VTSKSKTLDEIFIEARREYNTALIDGDGYEACIFLGVKISKDNTSGEIKIYDPSKSVNYYVEVDKQTYLMFQELGWRGACIEITLVKYKEKLERVKDSIAQEMNGNQSPKRLRVLKETREQLLNKYYKLTQKLNDEKSIQSTG